MQRLLLAAVSSLLVLSACGDDGGSGSGLDGISVSKAATPKVTGLSDFSSDTTEVKVIEEGSGDEVAEGDSVKLNYLAVNGRTGKQFDSSYAAGKSTTFTLNDTSVLPGFITSLKGQKVGSRILAAIAPKDGFNAERTEFGLKKDDTMVFVFDIVVKVPDEATGEAKKVSKSVPALQLDEDGHPTGFKATNDAPKKVTKASAHVAIEGEGATIEEDQTLSVHYVGQVYPDGKVFDSSWTRGAPSSFALTQGQLIECWTDLLVGQKVGSRVILVCPADTAYGDEGSPPDIEGGDTLLFAIDLLDAS